MFGMSLTEILVIVLIILVVLGPEKIPEVARFIGKGLREVRKASNLLRDAVMLDEDDFRDKRAPAAAAASMGAAAGADAGALEQTAMRDPDPKRDVRVVQMRRPRGAEKATKVTEVSLSQAAADLTHREVYLHVPYDETI
jgi:TatA/E family protein of Tat protein translocase